MNSFDDIVQSITRGNLKEALAGLSEKVATNENLSNHRNAIITLSARYHQLQRRRISGLISSGEAQITENQIRFNTLELIDMLKRDSPSPTTNNTTQGDENNSGEKENNDTLAFDRGKKIRVLFVAAEPANLKRSYTAYEFSEIHSMLLREGFSNRLEIIQIPDTSPKKLTTYLLEYQPNIVHFSGHGDKEGIYLSDDNRQKVLVSKEKLGEVFDLFKDVVGCVFLNACYSAPQTSRIKESISYVIGTSHLLKAKVALEFSSKFYEALGKGKDIAFAFEFAKVSVSLEREQTGYVLME